MVGGESNSEVLSHGEPLCVSLRREYRLSCVNTEAGSCVSAQDGRLGVTVKGKGLRLSQVSEEEMPLRQLLKDGRLVASLCDAAQARPE